MYRDEQNLYHYVYRRDGTETDSQDYYQPSQPPIQEISNALEMKPVKKKVVRNQVKNRRICPLLRPFGRRSWRWNPLGRRQHGNL